MWLLKYFGKNKAARFISLILIWDFLDLSVTNVITGANYNCKGHRCNKG